MLKLLVFSAMLIAMLVFAGIANDWLRNKMGVQTPPPPPPQPIAPPPELLYVVYPAIGDCLRRCVNNSDIGLYYTRNPIHNHVDVTQRVLPSKKYSMVLVYKFQRIPEGGLNVHTIGSRKYNTFPVKNMVRIINQSLKNYCISLGCTPVVVVNAKDIGDGCVLLAVAEVPNNLGGDMYV